jgi:hypothetical protein
MALLCSPFENYVWQMTKIGHYVYKYIYMHVYIEIVFLKYITPDHWHGVYTKTKNSCCV